MSTKLEKFKQKLQNTVPRYSPSGISIIQIKINWYLMVIHSNNQSYFHVSTDQYLKIFDETVLRLTTYFATGTFDPYEYFYTRARWSAGISNPSNTATAYGLYNTNKIEFPQVTTYSYGVSIRKLITYIQKHWDPAAYNLEKVFIQDLPPQILIRYMP